jgi:hypothetical protein
MANVAREAAVAFVIVSRRHALERVDAALRRSSVLVGRDVLYEKPAVSTYLAPSGCTTVPISSLTCGASMIQNRSAVSKACVTSATVVTTYNQSRDHGEQHLGILYLLYQIRISTLDIARDADIEILTSRPLDSIGKRVALTGRWSTHGGARRPNALDQM